MSITASETIKVSSIAFGGGWDTRLELSSFLECGIFEGWCRLQREGGAGIKAKGAGLWWMLFSCGGWFFEGQCLEDKRLKLGWSPLNLDRDTLRTK